LSKEGTKMKGKAFKCKYCGATFDELWQLGNHVKYECEDAKKSKESAKEKVGEGPLTEEKSLSPRQLVAQFGRDGLNQIKKERLKKVLQLAPGVGAKSIPYILHKWDVNARVRDDPMSLYNMLHQEAGLKPNIAQSVTVDVFSVEEEYADLLYQRGETPIFYRPPSPGAQPPAFMGWGHSPPIVPSYWPVPAPMQGVPAPMQGIPAPMPGMAASSGTHLTPNLLENFGKMMRETEEKFEKMMREREEKFDKMMKEREEKSRVDKLEERLNKLDKDFAGALTSLKDDILKRLDERPGVQYEEVQEYIDAKGRVCSPDKAVSVRVRKVPIREERKSLIEQFKELKEAGVIATQKDLLDILERKKPVDESIEGHPTFKSMKEKLEEYKRSLDEYKRDYEKLKDAMADEEKKRMQSTIAKLEDRIANLTTLMSRGTGQWRTDEMRVISGLLSDVKDLLKERKPITEVKEMLVPQGVTQARPPSERAGVEERGGVLQRLAREGLVVKVLEKSRR